MINLVNTLIEFKQYRKDTAISELCAKTQVIFMWLIFYAGQIFIYFLLAAIYFEMDAFKHTESFNMVFRYDEYQLNFLVVFEFLSKYSRL